MSTIVLRATKGSALTHAEGDANFNNLNTDKAEITDLASTVINKGASLIGIHDAGGLITATTVEGALAENRAAIDADEAALAAHLADAADAHAGTAITNTPAGTIAATTVQAAINELDGDITAHVGDATAAHAASAISNTPAGTIAATDVQAAINELDGDVVAHLGDTTDAHDASAISVLDTGGRFTSTDVEGALAEAYDKALVAATETNAGIVELATSAEVQTGTDTGRVPSVSSLRGGLLVSGTPITTTSGASHDFTGIPSWAKRIHIILSGVSTTGTSNPLIQIGDSGGIENTGYLGAGAVLGVATNYTTGFGFPSATAAEVFHGTITLYNITGNVWVASGTLGLSNAANMLFTAGSKTLSATLDRVRLTTVGGTDTFDAGTFNIIYE